MTGRQSSQPLGIPQALDLLRNGALTEAHGLLPWGSNYTFLVTVTCDDQKVLAIYKPRRGERPLWDFPDGTLCLREIAAFVISEALGWHIVPPTVLRDGPQGLGMVQLRVEHDPENHYFTLGPEFRDQLKRIALFDHFINNADRKGGHCLVDGERYVWAIDHGICFHTQPKLRTVIWDFAGEKIDAQLIADVQRVVTRLGEVSDELNLQQFLSAAELRALRQRGESLVQVSRYPEPGPGRQYPWPPV